MLTPFTTAKSFKGLANIIQRNALHSWTVLEPRGDIILVDLNLLPDVRSTNAQLISLPTRTAPIRNGISILA